ncbi:PSP1 domain-containing protein [Haloplasma contractile]|uniref:Stage 0 sporulation protein YaaT n=1 Tax=Haloplasma contractile SSD-17B TaxID=1033810 RepID=U2FMF7_9MOLU|nr:regulatory iron-sulfur-containing complex subunit RicT [Haloplasma contractile]ERJ12349.1 Stage 0 sporulation protein YaaT [Haloplasma contractile SSD-17B]
MANKKRHNKPKNKGQNHHSHKCGSRPKDQDTLLKELDEIKKEKETQDRKEHSKQDRYNVIGVRFKRVGKKYFFDPRDLDLSINDQVLVETVRGIEFGEVVTTIQAVSKEEVFLPLKPIIRKAEERDITHYNKNKEEEPTIMDTCNGLIKKHKLDMNLLSCEYTFDRTKLIFYFSAENRVDFRQLVKELASIFKTRIELRQIGVRDAAKYIGGLGPCGRVLCCNTFLGDFDTVSIKMAKKQNLSLNPQKISGACGKLLCCLRYESEYYEEMSHILPKVGETVMVGNINARVIGVNAVTQNIKVSMIEDDEQIIKKINIDELKRLSNGHDDDENDIDDELKALEE